VCCTTYRTEKETCYRDVCYTVCKPVTETKEVQVCCGEWKTVQEHIPGPVVNKCVCEPGCWQWDPCRCCCVYKPGPCKTVQVQCPGRTCCRRVWVPKTVTKQICCTRMVKEVKHCKVPYTVCKRIPVTTTKRVPYTTCTMVKECKTRRVPYRTCSYVKETCTKRVPYRTCSWVEECHTKKIPYRTCSYVTECYTKRIPYRTCTMVKECRTKKVPYQTCSYVQEQRTRKVPYCTCKRVCETRHRTVRKCVARQVQETRTRCVPRVVCKQVPVQCCCDPCCPQTSCAPKCGCDG